MRKLTDSRRVAAVGDLEMCNLRPFCLGVLTGRLAGFQPKVGGALCTTLGITSIVTTVSGLFSFGSGQQSPDRVDL